MITGPSSKVAPSQKGFHRPSQKETIIYGLAQRPRPKGCTQTHAHAYAHNAPLESPRCAASFTTPAARDRTRPHSPTPSSPPPRPPPTPAPPSCPLPRRSTAHFSLSRSFPAPFLINPLSQRQRALPTRHGSTTSRQQHHATHTHTHTHKALKRNFQAATPRSGDHRINTKDNRI
jgi:hypothetical protein